MFVDLDPGALKLALAAKTVATIALCYALTLLLLRTLPHGAIPPLAGLPDQLTTALHAALDAARQSDTLAGSLALMAAIQGANFFMMLPQDRYGVELRWFLWTALAMLGGFTLVGLAGPGSWGMDNLPVSILWVVLITIGIFLRAWGPEMRKLGLLLGLSGLSLALFNPTHEAGLWYPAVTLIVILVVFVLRFLTIRPSLVLAYDAQCERFQDIAAAELARYRKGLPVALDDHGAPRDLLRHRWTILQKFATGAIKERPKLAPRYEAKLVAAYRISVAAMALREAYAAMERNERDAVFGDPRLCAVLDRLIARLGTSSVAAFPSQRLSDPELEDILDDLIDPATGLTAANVQQMRFIYGLIRFEDALNDFLEARLSIDIPSPAPATGTEHVAARRRSFALARRCALQGLLAASITTVLQFTYELNHAYWATLTVLLVLNGGAGQTTIRTLQRFLGTVGGVAAAIVVVPLVGSSTPLGVAMMILVLPLIMLTMETRYAIASGGIGFLMGMMLHITEHAGNATILARAYETGIGAGIALVTSLVFFPSFSGHQATPRLTALVGRCRTALARIEKGDSIFVTHSLLNDLQTLQADVPAIVAERRMFGHNVRDFEEFVFLLNAFMIYLGQYESSRHDLAKLALPDEARHLINDLQASLLDALDRLEKLLADGDDPQADFERRLSAQDVSQLPAGLIGSRHDLAAVVALLMAGNRLGSNVNDLTTVARRLERQ